VADLDFLATDSTHLVKVASEEVVEVLHAVGVDSIFAYLEDAVGFALVKAARVVVLVEPVFVVVDLWLPRVALLQKHQKVWTEIRRCWISDVPSIRTAVLKPQGIPTYLPSFPPMCQIWMIYLSISTHMLTRPDRHVFCRRDIPYRRLIWICMWHP
jgi:uncharacterized membrane protein (Fun14 family)